MVNFTSINLKNSNKSDTRLRKLDRAINALKTGSRTVGKGFQRVKLIIQKSRYIINPRTALLGLMFTVISIPSSAMALEGAAANLSLSAFLAVAV